MILDFKCFQPVKQYITVLYILSYLTLITPHEEAEACRNSSCCPGSHMY